MCRRSRASEKKKIGVGGTGRGVRSRRRRLLRRAGVSYLVKYKLYTPAHAAASVAIIRIAVQSSHSRTVYVYTRIRSRVSALHGVLMLSTRTDYNICFTIRPGLCRVKRQGART